MPLASKKKAPKLLPPKKLFGQEGETRATHFLVNKGWQILERNVQLGHQEIDIIAFDPQYQEIVFVEVKTRHHNDYGDPALSVNERKLRALTTASAKYIRNHHCHHDYRFDIIAVLPEKIEHFVNVTWP